jgi:hypothetical protein
MAKYDAEVKKCIDAYIRDFVSLRKPRDVELIAQIMRKTGMSEAEAIRDLELAGGL